MKFIIMVITVLVGSAPSLVGQPAEYDVEVLLPQLSVRWSHGMAHGPDGKLFVADRDNHRVLVLEDDQVVEVFGGIGQKPGELYRPSSLAHRDGRLAVVEQGNFRVQIISTEGIPQSAFPVTFVNEYVALGPDDRVLLNHPESGYLFSSYSPKGELRTQYGKLITEKEAYPGRANGSQNQTSLNRVQLQADREGNIFAVFQFIPLVQKWSPAGVKLWQRRLESANIESLVKGLWEEPGGIHYSTKSVAGEEKMPVIITASCLTARGDLIVVLADQALFWISGDGVTAGPVLPRGTARIVFHAVSEFEGTLYFASASRLYRSVGTIELAMSSATNNP
ncbi:MAG TPA: hypothetical protein VLV83_13235 [Acidobacteriota bacterium]|nr:hypothetical protein [Acidobacteriota bacterium]